MPLESPGEHEAICRYQPSWWRVWGGLVVPCQTSLIPPDVHIEFPTSQAHQVILWTVWNLGTYWKGFLLSSIARELQNSSGLPLLITLIVPWPPSTEFHTTFTPHVPSSPSPRATCYCSPKDGYLDHPSNANGPSAMASPVAIRDVMGKSGRQYPTNSTLRTRWISQGVVLIASKTPILGTQQPQQNPKSIGPKGTQASQPTLRTMSVLSERGIKEYQLVC